MAGLRNLTLAVLVADQARLGLLIAEGETLFVERKRELKGDAVAAAVASFANTLGGWVLIGVENDGTVRGLQLPGRAELQDHLRHLLASRIDPLPPFAAEMIDHEGRAIGVVRVAESADTPHIITSTGAIYVREPGGKRPVGGAESGERPLRDHRTLVELATRGKEARREAERRLRLPMLQSILASRPDFSRRPESAVLQWIVRASPFTVPGHFADAALAETSSEVAGREAHALFVGPFHPPRQLDLEVNARARGFHLTAKQRTTTSAVGDIVLDAGGSVVARFTQLVDGEGTIPLKGVGAGVLVHLARIVSNLLTHLDSVGRAAVSLELAGAQNLAISVDTRTMGTLNGADLVDGRVHVGGELAIPPDAEDVEELVGRWVRELARVAGLPLWEGTTA